MNKMAFRNTNSKNTLEQPQKPREIVGLHWDPHPRPWWIPPGLEHTHNLPFTYVPPFFGADREYGPEEGWQTVSSRKQRQAARRRNRKRTPVYYQEVEEEDTYEFTDE